ncbi:MAG: hypothetical protein ABIS86_16470 [Streptosporangiaceae bacterium]
MLTYLSELPEELRHRAGALKSPRSGCERCTAAATSLRMATEAAHYDDLVWAERLLVQAEAEAAHEHVRPEQIRQVPHIRSGIHGQVSRWAGERDLLAATDAGWKQRSGGMGYLVSDGSWGLRGWSRDRLDPTGSSRVLVTELRAIDFMLARLPERPMTVLVDSTSALEYLDRWQGGDVRAMPAGYDLRARSRDQPPTLVGLAELIAGRPDLIFRHIKGHSGHLLNEAADSLAKIARLRVTETFDAAARAEGLVEAFLVAWHLRSPARTSG